MITVATYFWSDPARAHRGYSFIPDHVRILRNMVARHLTLPHRFVCVTDDPVEGIDCVPLDWGKHVPGTVFIRLMQHNPEWALARLGERILSLDLDVVITGNFDHVASRTEDFLIWRNPNYPHRRSSFYQSSVQLFSAGARPQLWSEFDPSETPKWVNRRFTGAEQAWISECLGFEEATFGAHDGIYGAGGLEPKEGPTVLPQNACIVSFPGKRDPSQAHVQAIHPWIVEHYR